MIFTKSFRFILILVPSTVNLESMIGVINEAAKEIECQFRVVRDEHTGKRYCGIANMRNDSLSQKATNLTAKELEYYKVLVC